MDLNNFEKEFLNLLGIKYIKDKNMFIANNGKTYEFYQTDQSAYYKDPKGNGFIKILRSGKKGCIREIVLDENFQMFGIEQLLHDDNSISTTLSLSTYTIEEKEKCKIYGERYKISVFPTFDKNDEDNLVLFLTAISGIEKELYIENGLSTIKVSFDDKQKNIEKYRSTIDIYKKLLTKVIRYVYKNNYGVSDFFLKMMPVFELIYNELEENQKNNLNDYLDKLALERNKINEEADNEIAIINSRRDRYLKLNYDRQQELLNSSKQKRK